MDQTQVSKENDRYVPLNPPDSANLEEYRNWLLQELQRVSTVIEWIGAGNCDVLYKAPAKPRTGMIRFADGTQWNPGGQGRGYYGYDEASGSWRKLG